MRFLASLFIVRLLLRMEILACGLITRKHYTPTEFFRSRENDIAINILPLRGLDKTVAPNDRNTSNGKQNNYYVDCISRLTAANSSCNNLLIPVCAG